MKSAVFAFALGLVMGMVALGGGAAQAGELQLCPMVGYRVFGSFQDYYTGTQFDIKDDMSFGGMADIVIPGGRAIEFLYSRQESRIVADGYWVGTSSADMTVEIWHLGVLQEKPVNPTTIAYGAGSLGVTHFITDLDSPTKFSVGFGGGVKRLLGERVGLRLDARAYVTFIGGSSFYAGGGTGGLQLSIASNAVFQMDFTAGAVIRLGKAQ